MSSDLSRREFIGGLAAVPVAANALQAAQQSAQERTAPVQQPKSRTAYVVPAAPIIDCHIHLFDKSGEKESPYPNDFAPGLTSLPPRYRWTVHGSGIVGVIVTECSSYPEDTLWVLEQCATDPMFVGHCGYLDFGSTDFVKYFDKFHANKLFLGVRYARANLEEAPTRPVLLGDIKTMTDAGLVLELGSRSPIAIARLADKLPASAKIVIPHLPRTNLTPATSAEYRAGLKELRSRPNVAMKLSGVTKFVDGKVVSDVAMLKDWLDELWDVFGEDRVVYGTDWPHEERTAPFLQVLSTATSYARTKPAAVQEKVFWRNSARIYKWAKRAPDQPAA